MAAIERPASMSRDGLLIAIWLITRLNDEKTLFAIAGEMERAGYFVQTPIDG